MAIKTGIEWTDSTVNLHHGCSKVNAGCDHCYAEAIARRYGNDMWGADKPRKKIKSAFTDLARLQKAAAKAGVIHTVFVGSMMDIFEKPMPMIDHKGNALDETTGDRRLQFFQNIEAGMYDNLMFLLLTKRPSNINKYILKTWRESPPENVMFGTSVVNQLTAVTFIEHLLKVNGSRFLSVEPQLAEITLLPWLQTGGVDWVIQGGESGAGRRAFDCDWGRKLKAECEATGTAYFFKQVDKVKEIPLDLRVRQFPDSFCSGCIAA